MKYAHRPQKNTKRINELDNPPPLLRFADEVWSVCMTTFANFLKVAFSFLTPIDKALPDKLGKYHQGNN